MGGGGGGGTGRVGTPKTDTRADRRRVMQYDIVDVIITTTILAMASEKAVRRCDRVYYMGTVRPKTYGPTRKRDYAAAGRSNSHVKTRKKCRLFSRNSQIGA